MPENEIKTEPENNFANVENVSAKDLAGIEFPPVNTAAVAAVGGVGESAVAANPTPDGWDGNIHAYPPRKNKRGEWAKKRGNKKGYVFGKPKNANPPPLNSPPDAGKVAVEVEKSSRSKRGLRRRLPQTGLFWRQTHFPDMCPKRYSARCT